jgi:predicted lipoprotein with Yx(FWY)xxD motif
MEKVESLAVGLGEDDDLGQFLVGPNGFTLYTFANDALDTTNCYDQCAVNWPPFLLEEEQPVAAAEGISGDFGSIKREDGGSQVTYNGQPLYYWVNDEKPGDTTGHGVKDVWAVARPASKVALGGNEELGRFLMGDNGNVSHEITLDLF